MRLSLSSEGTQYFSTGIYTSTVFDAAKAVDWSSVDWTYSNTFYDIILEYRTGNISIPNNNWSNWVAPRIKAGEFICYQFIGFNEVNCNSNMGGIDSSRYIQYRATFTNGNASATVALFDIKVGYGTHPSSGFAISESIVPTDLLIWDTIFYTATIPVSTSLVVDVLSNDETVLIPNVNSGDSLANIDASAYTSIKLRASFSVIDTSRTPEIDVWGVTWVTGSRQYLPIILR